MRKVVGVLFITLDGVTESPEKWQFDSFDDDMMAHMEARIAATDTVLLGRTIYEEWEPYWPTSDYEPFASHINTVPKVVVSSTLKAVKWGEWGNAALLEGDLAEGIKRLKQQPGKNISVEGSTTLIRSLLAHNLLDELALTIHPVVAGSGKRLFEDGTTLQRMKLVRSKISRTGVLMVNYEPLRDA